MTEEMLNPDDPIVVGECPVCLGEIYAGETIYRINGETIHEECLREWAEREYRDEKEVLCTD